MPSALERRDRELVNTKYSANTGLFVERGLNDWFLEESDS